MKIIAFYLPQFHNIPENDEWWGNGFTEWVNVKKAKPLFEGHNQPRIPLNGNYYDLLDDDVKKWQANIAKKYGIYGFAYYHYWFNGKMLLQKPMEQMLQNKEVDIPFCISWANEPWTKAWVGKQKKVLIAQHYGDEKEWTEHFNYLLQFFKDERYIKIDNKPLFIFYRPELIPNLTKMIDCWNNLAKLNGFSGIKIASQSTNFIQMKSKEDEKVDYHIEFQPFYAVSNMRRNKFALIKKIRRNIVSFFGKFLGIDLLRYEGELIKKILKYNRVNYDTAWKELIKNTPISEKNLPGAFVGWDNTPRYGENSTIYVGESPEKFENYLDLQIKNVKENYKTDMLFMYAWNEWAEGGYLEPDEKDGYKKLEAIRNALIKNNEFPW